MAPLGFWLTKRCFLLKPVLLYGKLIRFTRGFLALDLDLLGLIGLQLLSKKSLNLLRASRDSGGRPLFDLALAVREFGNRRLVSPQFAEIDILNLIGC